jgi:hypothetical protein
MTKIKSVGRHGADPKTINPVLFVRGRKEPEGSVAQGPPRLTIVLAAARWPDLAITRCYTVGEWLRIQEFRSKNEILKTKGFFVALVWCTNRVSPRAAYRPNGSSGSTFGTITASGL